MPVRGRSRSSMAAICWRPVVEMVRRSSSSASTPAAIAPPSTSVSGGSSTRVVAIRAVTSFERVEALGQARASARACIACERHFQAGQTAQTGGEGAQIAGAGGIEREPGKQPLQIEKPGECAANLFALDQVCHALRRRLHSGLRVPRRRPAGAESWRASRRLPMGVWQASRVWKSVARDVLTGKERLDQFEIAHGDLIEFERRRVLLEIAGCQCAAPRSSAWCGRSGGPRRRRWRLPDGRSRPKPSSERTFSWRSTSGTAKSRVQTQSSTRVRAGMRSSCAGNSALGGERTSLGPALRISSTACWRAAGPVNSAVRNSPVETSSRATAQSGSLWKPSY